MFDKQRDENEENVALYRRWGQALQETQDEWFSFLGALEMRMEDLCFEAIPALETAFMEDTDIYKRGYGIQLFGIKGQLDEIWQLAYDVRENKFLHFCQMARNKTAALSTINKRLVIFIAACDERYKNGFENKYSYWLERLSKTGAELLAGERPFIPHKSERAKFERAKPEQPKPEQPKSEQPKFEQLKSEQPAKDKFHCEKCGTALTFKKIFFKRIYARCIYCQPPSMFGMAPTEN